MKVSETPGGRFVVGSENHTKSEWKKLTEPILVNAMLAKRNTHHLQQMSYKVGIDTKRPFTTLRENAGFNKMATKAKNKEQVVEFNATPKMLVWFKGFKQTDQEKEECTPVIRWISSTEFQAMFKVAREATSFDS